MNPPAKPAPDTNLPQICAYVGRAEALLVNTQKCCFPRFTVEDAIRLAKRLECMAKDENEQIANVASDFAWSWSTEIWGLEGLRKQLGSQRLVWQGQWDYRLEDQFVGDEPRPFDQPEEKDPHYGSADHDHGAEHEGAEAMLVDEAQK